MTRRDWWLGLLLLALAILAHAAFPRYEWHPMRGDGIGSAIGMLRVDRWRGTSVLVFPTSREVRGVETPWR